MNFKVIRRDFMGGFGWKRGKDKHSTIIISRIKNMLYCQKEHWTANSNS